MTVYVDDAKNPFSNMLMCHLWADTREELIAFAIRIGVNPKWIQEPPKASWVHFDIAQSKRTLALSLGAVATDRYGPVEHVARLEGNQEKLDQIARIRAKHGQDMGFLI
jgi:hypothetical protein